MSAPVTAVPIAPGAHIEVRDAVWRVVQVNRTSGGRAAWHVVGLSEVVRDQEAIFLEEYEPEVKVLDPRETRLVPDPTPGHRRSRLYLESKLRRLPPMTTEPVTLELNKRNDTKISFTNPDPQPLYVLFGDDGPDLTDAPSETGSAFPG